ncbi:O-antigen translocase [Yersinia kristensenii]|uniref:O-antigen translocase n=1 Tax=Yersinia kristensenii TaxID=28152 RepID=UPI0005E4BDA1|nr:O-antigen translocase [Yersinia kristensenii]CNH18804.1 putative lipopolysaccharide biosynthesis protein [Yersinia kristensenii]CNK87391.1 putative lipopolysaccharide biosynthesis protein [Yersinia kristensenii]
MKALLSVTFFTALLTFVRMASGFLIVKVIALYAGPAGIAMLGQLQSAITSMSGFVNAAASSGVVRYTAENKSKGFEICSLWWRASIQWIMVLCSIVIPILALLSPILSDWLFESREFYWLIIVTAVLLPVSALGTMATSIINGLENYRRYIVLGMLSAIFSSLVMVIMIIKANILGALIAASFQNALVGMIMIIGTSRQKWFKFSYFWGKVESVYRKDIGKYILMSATAALTMPVALICIRNILVTYVGWEQAGYWQAVWKISEAYLAIITIALSTYYLPQLSKLTTFSDIKKEVHTTVIVLIPIVIVLSVLVYLLRDIIIYILFTKEFILARDLFSIQLIGDVFKILAWIFAFPMIARGATKWYMLSEIIFSICFVGLSWLCIHLFDLQGANIAYAINYIIYSIFMYANMKRFCV